MRPNGFPTIRLSQLAQLYALHSQLLNKIIEGEPQKNVEELFRCVRIGLLVNPSCIW